MTVSKTAVLAITAALLTGPVLAQSNRDMPGMMAMNMGTQATQPITGKGVVKKVDPARKTVNLNHEAIPAIGWPAMAMDFLVAPEVDLSSLQAGQSVDFTLAASGVGTYTVTGIKPGK